MGSTAVDTGGLSAGSSVYSCHWGGPLAGQETLLSAGQRGGWG